jgi:hypothetical protein
MKGLADERLDSRLQCRRDKMELDWKDGWINRRIHEAIGLLGRCHSYVLRSVILHSASADGHATRRHKQQDQHLGGKFRFHVL